MRNLVCIVCPRGCSLSIDKSDGRWLVSGNHCRRGKDFAISEATNPKRSLSSTVRTTNRNLPCLPVRTDTEVPLEKVFEIIALIHETVVDHLVHTGDIILYNVCETGSNIIATSDTYYILDEINQYYDSRGNSHVQ